MEAQHTACQECGAALSRARKGFCCTACRDAFNNRRKTRGADAYDLLRAIRRERDTAKRLNIWTELCRLELTWFEEDQRDRPGRRSYIAPERALVLLSEKGALPRGELLVKSYLGGRKPNAA